MPLAGQYVSEPLVLEKKCLCLALCAGEVHVGQTDVEVGFLVGRDRILYDFLTLEDVSHPAFDLELPG